MVLQNNPFSAHLCHLIQQRLRDLVRKKVKLKLKLLGYKGKPWGLMDLLYLSENTKIFKENNPPNLWEKTTSGPNENI